MSKFREAAYRERAKDDPRFSDENIFDFDDEPAVSLGTDSGAYVQVWVWIPDEEIGI